MTRRLSLLSAAIAGLALLAMTGGAAASEFRLSDVTGQGYGEMMPRLIGPDGRARDGEDFKGRVTVLFFGFTHCADLCPTTLTTLSAVLDRLGEESDDVRVAFVTVDPERDTPDVLRHYLEGFGPNFVGLTGEPAAIRRMAKAFRVFFRRMPLPDGDYTMDHSAAIYVLDRQARTRLMFTASSRVVDIAHDILALLREAC